MFVNPLPLLACHCSAGAGVPLAAAVNDTTVPVQALVLTGLAMTMGLLIVSVATLEVVLPQVLENTARNWLLLCETLAVKLYGLVVAPGMLVNPPPLLACHCSDGAGVPLAAAVNDTTVPVQALVLSGLVLTIGLLIVSVATLEVVLPQVVEDTARHWLLLFEVLVVELSGLVVVAGGLV